jgi:hypothetical protein
MGFQYLTSGIGIKGMSAGEEGGNGLNIEGLGGAYGYNSKMNLMNSASPFNPTLIFMFFLWVSAVK